MFAALSAMASGLCLLFLGTALGAAWIAAVVAPNCSYDRLDHSRADGHVRQLLVQASTPIAGLHLAAAAFGLLGGAYAAAALALVSAFGFFSNRWTLAPKKKGEGAPGVRQRRKTQRVVAVSFTLLFTAVSGIAALLAVFNI